MKKGKWLCRVLLSLCLVLLLGVGTPAQGFLDAERTLAARQADALREMQENAGAYSDEVLVLENTTPARAAALAARLDAKLRMTSDGTFATLTLPSDESVTEVLSSRKYRDILNELSLDTVCEAAGERENAAAPTPQWPNYTVNDTDYDVQTHLKYVGLGSTWSRTRGEFADGSKVKVAIVDSGIDTEHPEFFDADGESIISKKSYNTRTDTSVEQGGWSTIKDTRGHGTWVAGVIAAQMNDVGTVGIAPDVELLVIKADNDNGKYYDSDLTFGIDYAVEQGAHVINMSINGEGPITGNALQNAVANDVIFVCSAGNEQSDTPLYPSSDPLSIGVGSLAADSWGLAYFSSYGKNTDLVAPGMSIYTTDVGGGYISVQGTSFSSPIVAAAVALYISAYGVTPHAELKARLLASCADIGEPGVDTYFGHGALNISDFLDPSTVKVSFDHRMANVPKEYAFVKSGSRLTQSLPAPEAREGLQFEGWYLDARLTQRLDKSTHIFREATTLYARWLGETSGDFDYYEYARGFVKILGYHGDADAVQIPDQLDGKNVSVIAPYAFVGDAALKEISLPPMLHTIGEGAFAGCEDLAIVRVHSSSIAEQITAADSPGGICRYARAILMETSVDFDGETIAQTHPYSDTVKWGERTYTKYSDHEIEWIEGDALAARIPCVQDGIVQLTCSGCACTGELLIPKHTEGEWALDTPATCTTKGSEALQCADCQAPLQTRQIAATGHAYPAGVTVAPTCEEQGYLLRVCQSCGFESKTARVPAKGHTQGTWTVVLKPTKTEDGEEQLACVSCDKVLETQSIDACTHLLRFETNVAALTGGCTKASYTALAEQVAYYGTLSEDERLLVQEEYARLADALESYNKSATARNEELAQSVESPSPTLARAQRSLGALWYALCEKSKERGETV